MLAFATVAWKSFKGKFLAKIYFPIGYFRLPSASKSPGGAGLYFLFFLLHIFNVLTFAHGMLC